MTEKITKEGFGKKVFGNTFFSVLDILLFKVSTVLAFIILVRILPVDDIAILGIAGGYLVFIGYLDVAPIRVLLRDYPKISKQKKQRDHVLTAFFLFWLLQAALMLCLFLMLDYTVFSDLKLKGISFVFFALTMDFIALSLSGWLKTIFYIDFKQKKATKISFFLAIGRVSTYSYLIFYPTLDAYAELLIAFSIFSNVVWFSAFLAQFKYKPSIDKNTIKILKDSLHDYGLWDHFNRTVINTLFIIDVVIISYYATLSEVADYTIALKFTSLLAIMSMQLNRSLQVSLSNIDDESKRQESISLFFKINAAISIGQLIVIVSFGDLLLMLLFGPNLSSSVYEYSVIISVGVTLFNIAFPVLAIANNFCKIKQLFILVFLPSLISGLLGYYFLSIGWGVIGVCYGNIFCYLILASLLILYTKKKYHFSLNILSFNDNEKKIMRGFMKALVNK
ncbi:MAG: hypothetical protein COB30_012355 [Ectothiorhodospiraceae bacterium]|nr:hypothetical protein [Ectothiorhodospiraceae bacterium]